MVKFPEVNARVLPEFEDFIATTLESKTNRVACSRRTWKSAQMAVTSICIPFPKHILSENSEKITSMTQKPE